MGKKQKYCVVAVGACINDEIIIPNEAKALSIHIVEGRVSPIVVTWLEEVK